MTKMISYPSKIISISYLGWRLGSRWKRIDRDLDSHFIVDSYSGCEAKYSSNGYGVGEKESRRASIV